MFQIWVKETHPSLYENPSTLCMIDRMTTYRSRPILTMMLFTVLGSLLMNTCLQMMTLGYLEHIHHSGFDRLLTKLMSMLSSLEDGIFSPLWSKAPHTRSKLDPKGGRSLCLSGQIYNLLQVQTEIAGFMFGSRTYTSNVKKN